jgi:alpha-beta hydrolase superfamily lysophospholipase
MPQPIFETTFTFADPDGFQIFVRKWAPAEEVMPKAVVQIAHGAAEHSLRYERFGKFLNQAGYMVYANDHRGHGKTAGSLDKAGLAGVDGWNGIVKDAKQLTELIKKENPGLPVFLFGHSLGSLLAQHYIQRWGRELRGVVLCGSSGARQDLDKNIASLEKLPREGISKAMFREANKRFEPGKTGFEWLSRDEDEVQKYVDDPWCGFPFSFGFSLDFLKGIRDGWKAENEALIPKDLPVFIISGDDDPAAGDHADRLKLLIGRYQALGLKDLAAKLYPGARHEILNETNRDEVQRDLLAWFEARLTGK